MIEGPPQLDAEWIPEPFENSTVRGTGLVVRVASETLSWDDLWRIRATADWRVVRGRRSAEQMEREIVLLEGAVRELKNRDAMNQAKLSILQHENQQLRKLLENTKVSDGQKEER